LTSPANNSSTTIASAGVSGSLSSSTIPQTSVAAPQGTGTSSTNYTWMILSGSLFGIMLIGFATVRSQIMYTPDLSLSP
jgi:hypothetical protein